MFQAGYQKKSKRDKYSFGVDRGRGICISINIDIDILKQIKRTDLELTPSQISSCANNRSKYKEEGPGGTL